MFMYKQENNHEMDKSKRIFSTYVYNELYVTVTLQDTMASYRVIELILKISAFKMYFQINTRNKDMLVRTWMSNRTSHQGLRFTLKDHPATYISIWQLVNKMEASVPNPIDKWCIWDPPDK